tara:strand:+ start:3667 stop:4422 length:756 start_codon:yes stop_codon:yes gene_type:complete
MKKIFTLFLLLPLLSISQTNCDTVYVDPDGQPYTATRTRGYWFRANSSFIISAVKAAEGNPIGVNSTGQSIEIIQFDALNLTTDTIPYDFSGIGAGFTNPHTSLFHAQDVPLGWITCAVNITKDRYYAILGAKNNTVISGSQTDMYNTVLPTGERKLMLNGDSTTFWRAALQYSLADGPGPSGQFFHDGPNFQGRIHTIICTGVSSINETTDDKEIIKVIDLIGRDSKLDKNKPLIYIYNDGSSEKKIIVD